RRSEHNLFGALRCARVVSVAQSACSCYLFNNVISKAVSLVFLLSPYGFKKFGAYRFSSWIFKRLKRRYICRTVLLRHCCRCIRNKLLDELFNNVLFYYTLLAKMKKMNFFCSYRVDD
uniref:Secreted protein n=1 Tax=Parascaris univalens TaxID=6257 RepID=A0A915BS83_PARUN